MADDYSLHFPDSQYFTPAHAAVLKVAEVLEGKFAPDRSQPTSVLSSSFACFHISPPVFSHFAAACSDKAQTYSSNFLLFAELL